MHSPGARIRPADAPVEAIPERGTTCAACASDEFSPPSPPREPPRRIRSRGRHHRHCRPTARRHPRRVRGGRRQGRDRRAGHPLHRRQAPRREGRPNHGSFPHAQGAPQPCAAGRSRAGETGRGHGPLPARNRSGRQGCRPERLCGRRAASGSQCSTAVRTSRGHTSRGAAQSLARRITAGPGAGLLGSEVRRGRRRPVPGSPGCPGTAATKAARGAAEAAPGTESRDTFCARGSSAHRTAGSRACGVRAGAGPSRSRRRAGRDAVKETAGRADAGGGAVHPPACSRPFPNAGRWCTDAGTRQRPCGVVGLTLRAGAGRPESRGRSAHRTGRRGTAEGGPRTRDRDRRQAGAVAERPVMERRRRSVSFRAALIVREQSAKRT